MVKEQQTLDGYNKKQLLHIVEMYNLELDIKDLKKKKQDLAKAMLKVGKKKLVNLPSKDEVNKMIKKNPVKKPKELAKGQKKLTEVGIKKNKKK
jgi:hypothetical protein